MEHARHEQRMQTDPLSQTRYSQAMKTATTPPIRIEPALRQEIEQALGDGETMASLVESAVRTEVSRRRDQTEFVRRGLAQLRDQRRMATGFQRRPFWPNLKQRLLLREAARGP